MSVRQVLELYLNGQKVDLNDNGGIFLNYKQKDYQNPTIVKNSFSKTLTIPGTDVNNQVFNNIWHLTRVQTSALVPYFNQSKRCSFDLFMNGELIEQGYCKLDRIVRNGAEISYELTLYGGLGDFFYSLSYDNTNGIKKNLASLDYGEDLTFTINKDTVKQAWDDLEAGIQHPITFAPCYNGVPDVLDADKVLINTSGFNGTIRVNSGDTWTERNGFPTTSGEYGTLGGYAYAECGRELSEWQTRDLRSYLQRPVLHVPALFDAISNPDNNGGYEVELDPEFFTTTNPYYDKAYITLPMISELDSNKTEETSIISGTVQASVGSSTGETNISLTLDGKWDRYSINVNLVALCNDTNASELFSSIRIIGQGVGYIWGGFGMQLIGLDANRNQVAGSNIWWLTSEVDGIYRNLNEMTNGISMDSFKYSTDVSNSIGKFVRNGSLYYWSDTGLTFTLDSNVKIDAFRIKILPGNRFGNDIDLRRNYLGKVWSASTLSNLNPGYEMGFNALLNEAYGTKLSTTVSYSDSVITQTQLLSTDYTPADYLISYCKLFNLYFDKDVFRKRVRILLQKNFYDGEVNLTYDIDDKIDIKPLSFDHKWYSFNYSDGKGSLVEGYKAKYGTDYGQQRVNTGYEFDSETEDLLDGNVYRNAVDALEANKYYAFAVDSSYRTLPSFLTENVTYKLFNSTLDATEIEMGISRNTNMEPINPKSGEGLFYDGFNKVQFHNEEGKPVDGANVLLFYNGVKDVPVYTYWLTDDVGYMFQVNDKPTWLYTNNAYNGNTNIARPLSVIPQFSRYIMDDEHIYSTWDFGRVKELYIPEISYLDGETTIYERYWQAYINDLYDIDTRVITAYIKFEDKPTKESLKHFYYFENSYWVIQEIIDYNPTSYDLTKVVFVKVNDLNNYLSGGGVPPVPSYAFISVSAAGTIPYNQLTLPITVTKSAFANNFTLKVIAPSWEAEMEYTGRTETTLVIQYSNNELRNTTSSQRTIRIEAYLNDYDASGYTEVIQEAMPQILLSAPAQIPATQTTIPVTITTPGNTRVRFSGPDGDVYNDFSATTAYTHTYQIPANQHNYVEYYTAYAYLLADYGVDAAVGIEQLGASGPTLTGITLDNVSWVTDVPATGGTASYQNCTYTVTAHYSNGTTQDITSQAIMTGSTSINVPSTTATTREQVGVINVIAEYYDGPNPFTATVALYAYQAAATPPTPTQAYVTYNAFGSLNNQANVDLAVRIESYSGGTDVDTFQLSGVEDQIAGDIDVQLNPTAGTTNLRFIVSVTGFSASVDGQLSMKVEYADYDSDYQAIGTGGAIDFYKDYQSATPLIIDVVFTPSNQNRSAAVEEPEEETPETETE